jgi:Ca2+-binding RTX toxin-like protein
MHASARVRASVVLAVCAIYAIVLSSSASAVGVGDNCPAPDGTKNIIMSDASVIYGTAKSDYICGGRSANLIIAGELDDDIYSGGGNDIVVGGHGTDWIDGGTGDDWLRGGTNRDCYIGGDGADTVSFADLTPEVGASNVGAIADLTTADGEVNGVQPSCEGLAGAGRAEGQGVNEELADVENLVGSAFDDTLTANSSGSSHLWGGWGDDTLRGLSGVSQDDTLDGEEGDDTCTNNGTAASCGAGAETHRPREAFAAVETHGPDTGVIVLGSEGEAGDTLTLTRPTGTTVVLTSGSALNGTSSCPATPRAPSTTLTCSVSALTYAVMFGAEGADTVTLREAFPTEASYDLNGGPGNDRVNGSSTSEVLFSGAGGSDLLEGNAGDDALISMADPVGSGGDTLNAGEGDDQIVTDNACAGHTLWGGPGDDIIGFARQTTLGVAGGARRGVHAQLGEAAGSRQAYAIDERDNQVAGCAVTTILAGGETLEGTQQNDVLSGNESPNTIWGRAADDTIFGNGGNDIAKGQNGTDTVHGGNDNDDVTGGPGNDTLTGDNGADTVSGEGDNDIVNGGAGNDTLYGNEGGDELTGAGEDDTIRAGSGTDLLWGNEGTDQLYGEDGPDTLHGGSGNDELRGDEAAGAGIDVMFGDAGEDTLYGLAGNDNMSGNEGNDTLFGNEGDDLMFGDEGADSLFGGENADRLRARDGIRDREIDCGGGSDPAAERDSIDPAAVGCND